MILVIIIIYFVILAVLEFLFIVFSKDEKKEYIKKDTFDNITQNKINEIIIKHNLTINNSNDDVNINNYIGKFYLENEYGFYSNLNKNNLLESNVLYEFDIPVNIEIIKIKNDKNIIYYTE